MPSPTSTAAETETRESSPVKWGRWIGDILASKCGRFNITRRQYVMPTRHDAYVLNGPGKFLSHARNREFGAVRDAKAMAESLASED